MYIIIAFFVSDQDLRILPCTSNIQEKDLEYGQSVLQQYTPPQFTLVDVQPLLSTHLYTHRWLCTYVSPDISKTYFGLNEIRNQFMMYCPAGCTVTSVSIRMKPTDEAVLVEFTKMCLCRNTFTEKDSEMYCTCYRCSA